MSVALLMGSNMNMSHTDSFRRPPQRQEIITFIVEVLAIPEGGPSWHELTLLKILL